MLAAGGWAERVRLRQVASPPRPCPTCCLRLPAPLPALPGSQLACAKAWQQFLADFSSRYVAFRAAAQALAALDCLAGLAVLASSAG